MARLAAAEATPLPLDPVLEGETDVVILRNEDWHRIDAMLAAFELTRPPALAWSRLVDMWVFLTGRVSRHLRMRLADARLYRIVTMDLDARMLAYMEALFLGERTRARALAIELDLWTTCPSVVSSDT